MSDEVYDFESGDLSLDYANTKEWHGSQTPIEHLNSYDDLLTWGEQAGLLTAELAQRLQRLASEQPGKSRRLYESAIQLREALYHLYSNLYAGRELLPADLAALNAVVREAMAGQQLTSSAGELRWEWVPGIEDANLVLWPVARAAANLLTSDKAARVRECEDDRGCGYLFIDQSKNHSRRWCSMEGCGNRAKAKRHYSRIQAM